MNYLAYKARLLSLLKTQRDLLETEEGQKATAPLLREVKSQAREKLTRHFHNNATHPLWNGEKHEHYLAQVAVDLYGTYTAMRLLLPEIPMGAPPRYYRKWKKEVVNSTIDSLREVGTLPGSWTLTWWILRIFVIPFIKDLLFSDNESDSEFPEFQSAFLPVFLLAASEGSSSTFIGVATAAGGALTTAIVALWKLQIDSARKTEEKLNKCEEGHVKAQERYIELVDKVGELKGEQAGVQKLAEQVLKRIDENVRRTD